MQPFPMDEVRNHREEKIEKAQDLLAKAVGHLQSGQDWQEMLAKLARGGRFSIRRLSFRNQLLVEMQSPGATSVACYRAWLRAGRQVRRGEKALVILAPVIVKRSRAHGNDNGTDEDAEESVLVGFRPMATFAGDQTDPLPGAAGRPLPEPEPITKNLEGDEAFTGSVEALRDVALGLGPKVVTEVVLRSRRRGDSSGTHGWFEQRTRRIVVITGESSRAQVFKTLVHELAHAILHGGEDHHARSEMEVEAESVAFVVSHVLGLGTGTYSFPYVASWAGSESAEDMVLRSGQRIVKATNTILDALLRGDGTRVASVKGAA